MTKTYTVLNLKENGASTYVVVNLITKEVQSSWVKFKDAVEVAHNLNKALQKLSK